MNGAKRLTRESHRGRFAGIAAFGLGIILSAGPAHAADLASSSTIAGGVLGGVIVPLSCQTELSAAEAQVASLTSQLSSVKAQLSSCQTDLGTGTATAPVACYGSWGLCDGVTALNPNFNTGGGNAGSVTGFALGVVTNITAGGQTTVNYSVVYQSGTFNAYAWTGYEWAFDNKGDYLGTTNDTTSAASAVYAQVSCLDGVRQGQTITLGSTTGVVNGIYKNAGGAYAMLVLNGGAEVSFVNFSSLPVSETGTCP